MIMMTKNTFYRLQILDIWKPSKRRACLQGCFTRASGNTQFGGPTEIPMLCGRLTHPNEYTCHAYVYLDRKWGLVLRGSMTSRFSSSSPIPSTPTQQRRRPRKCSYNHGGCCPAFKVGKFILDVCLLRQGNGTRPVNLWSDYNIVVSMKIKLYRG